MIKTYDFIVGNPPYVESSKSISIPQNVYGNIYANVLEISSQQLSEQGVMGYIVPLSYIATPRMNKIRKFIDENLEERYLLSYSDRPDCLFTSVHQKLNILLAKKRGIKACYTNNYQYWYKHEREKLFEQVEIVENQYTQLSFVPKLGNDIEISILKKFIQKIIRYWIR